MKKTSSLLIVIFLLLSKKSFSCSCYSDAKFFELSYSSELVALVKVTKYPTYQDIYKKKTPLTMEVEIIEKYLGNEKRKKIKIWGDNGIQCRPYVSQFKIGNYYEAEEITSKLHMARNRYINEAVSIYNRVNKRRLLKKQLAQESVLTSKDSMDILHEFEKLFDET